MKKAIIFLLIMFSISAFGKKRTKGIFARVVKIKGNAICYLPKSKKKRLLKLHDVLKPGSIIKTEQNSKVVVKLKGGSLILISPESKKILNPLAPRSRRYRKAENNLPVIGSVKAVQEKKGLWDDDLVEMENKVKIMFNNKQYLNAIELMKEQDIDENKADFAYIKAVSLLKLGKTKESLKKFKYLSKKNFWEYREVSRYGLFLCNLQLDKKKEANKLYFQMAKGSKFFPLMKDLING